MSYDQLKDLIQSNSDSNKKSFDDVLRAIYKRKIFIIVSLILILIGGFLYTKFTQPIYESSVLLKKEELKQQNFQDEYRRLVSPQSQDDIGTEIELVKTRSVLEKVVKQLNLNFVVDKILLPSGKTLEINKSLTSYNLWLRSGHYSEIYPTISNIRINNIDKPQKFFITLEDNGKIQLNEAINDIFVYASNDTLPDVVNTENIGFTVNWLKPYPGTRFYFTIYDDFSSVGQLTSFIDVYQKENTNLIDISVRNKSPEMAQLLASTLSEQFRETRTEHQRDNIQSSFSFIDKQLKDVSQKLQTAEDKMSAYKAKSGITRIDRSSEDMVRFLSNLEAEKINNDLQLSEYEKKQNEMMKEYKSKGFFDQTYLSPDETNQGSSPFSFLLQQLSDLEVKRIELLQKKSESHPDVISINDQISQIKRKLSSYNQNTLTAYKIIIESLREKRDKLQNLINQYQNKIHNIPQYETTLAGLIRDKNVFEKVYNLLLDKREEMRIKEISQLQDIIVVDPATLPMFPVSPNRFFVTVISLFIWGVLVVAYILLREYIDKKYLTLDEIEKSLKLPILSIIPTFSKKLIKKLEKTDEPEEWLAYLSKENPGILESYKVLQTRLSFDFKGSEKIVMFTSCEEHSGKTTTVANLALSLAATDKKVLIIDADLKRCALSDMFGISRDLPGLSTFLSGDTRKPPIMNLTTFHGRSNNGKLLSILPAGDVSEKSSELFQSPLANELINALRTSYYDYILIDTPPVTRVVDSLILGRLLKNSILVVRYNFSIRDSVYWGIKEMKNENIKIFGTVVNACEIEKSTFRHKYGYGYGYKYGYRSGKNGKGKKKIESEPISV